MSTNKASGINRLECLYGGMSSEDSKEKQLLVYQVFMCAVSSPFWDDLPQSTRLDMCMLMDTIQMTMQACQEVYVEG